MDKMRDKGQRSGSKGGRETGRQMDTQEVKHKTDLEVTSRGGKKEHKGGS